MIKNQIADIYLDYLNNFLSYDGFAEYYGLSLEFAMELLNNGRNYHNERTL